MGFGRVRRLPAYGKQLLERRRAGDHPLEVALIYGQDWWQNVHDLPRLAIAPEEYEPGRFDFRMVAGLKVTLIDQVAGGLINMRLRAPNRFGIFYELVRELAEADAYVEVIWPAWCDRLPAAAMHLAWFGRATMARALGQYCWPDWWSEALDRKQSKRFIAWCQDSVTRNQRRFTERERGAAA